MSLQGAVIQGQADAEVESGLSGCSHSSSNRCYSSEMSGVAAGLCQTHCVLPRKTVVSASALKKNSICLNLSDKSLWQAVTVPLLCREQRVCWDVTVAAEEKGRGDRRVSGASDCDRAAAVRLQFPPDTQRLTLSPLNLDKWLFLK